MTDDELARLSRVLGVVALAGIPALTAAWAWGVVSAPPEGLLASLGPLPEGTRPQGARAALALGLTALPLAATLGALWEAAGLLRAYAGGDVLGAEPAARIGRIGRWLLTLSVLWVLVPTLQVLLVTWGNPPGARQLSVTLHEGVYLAALAGGLMAVIGAAMRRAAAARAELDGFV